MASLVTVQTASGSDVPPFVVLAPDAYDLRTWNEGTVTHASYRSREALPAGELRANIARQMKRRHWTPREKDFLGRKVTHLDGWDVLEDEKSGLSVHSSTGYWEDKKRNVVVYSLSYRCDSRTDCNHGQIAEVVVSRYPREAVAQLGPRFQEQLDELLRKWGVPPTK